MEWLSLLSFSSCDDTSTVLVATVMAILSLPLSFLFIAAVWNRPEALLGLSLWTIYVMMCMEKIDGSDEICVKSASRTLLLSLVVDGGRG